jgi:hypothetical protein
VTSDGLDIESKRTKRGNVQSVKAAKLSSRMYYDKTNYILYLPVKTVTMMGYGSCATK